MRLGDQRESSNIEDRRGISMGGAAGIGGIGTVVIIVISMLLGVDPSMLLGLANGVSQATGSQSQASRPADPNDPQVKFVAQVLGSTEDVWGQLFRSVGRQYRAPKLVLFSGVVQSACGTAQAASGPFYCPGDQQLYLDTSFFSELSGKLGAKGDLPRAYVIAHEVGHHVQTLLGTTAQVEAARRRGQEAGRVAGLLMELQADCYAGLWAKQADLQRGILEANDVEQGLNAAAAIGDDRLQKMSRGYAVPDSFTHGSSAQRVRWFRQGLTTGDPATCDTFKAPNP